MRPGSTATAATLVVSDVAASAAIAELTASQIDVNGSMLRADASSLPQQERDLLDQSPGTRWTGAATPLSIAVVGVVV